MHTSPGRAGDPSSAPEERDTPALATPRAHKKTVAALLDGADAELPWGPAPVRALVFRGQPAPSKKKGFEDLIAGDTAAVSPGSVTLLREGEVVVLTAGLGEARDVEALRESVLRRGRVGLGLRRLTVGVGRAYSGPEGLRRSYREARWAVRAAESVAGQDAVVEFERLGIYRMLEPFFEDPLAGDIEDVRRLIDFDRANETALLATAEAFLETGRTGEAAARLFCHRNTVIHRLATIRKVVGLDLRNPDDRLLLALELRLARVRGLLPEGDPGTPATDTARRRR